MSLLMARGLTATVSCSVSGLLALIVIEVVPPPVGLGLICAGILVLLTAASPVGEWVVVAALTASTPLNAVQRSILCEVLAHLEVLGQCPRHLLITTHDRSGQRSPWWYGRSTAVLTPQLVASVRSGAIGRDTAASAFVFARAERRAWCPGSGMVALVFTFPYRVITSVGQLLFSRGLPALGWKLRWIVAGVAVFQSFTESRAPYGVGVALLLALTYLMPALTRLQQRRAEAAADDVLVNLGLGHHYVHWVTQVGGTIDPNRQDRLISNPMPPPPRLRLVPNHP